MSKRLLLALVVGVLGAAVVAPAAHAAFGIEKWESITCKENVDTPGIGEKLIVRQAGQPLKITFSTSDHRRIAAGIDLPA